MFHRLIAPLALATALALGTGAASADSFRYVQQGVNLNARSGPGSHYATKKVLAPGTRLSVIRQQGNWAQVRTTEGLLLWVFGSHLRDQAPHNLRQPAQSQQVQQQVQQRRQQPVQQQTPPRTRPQNQQQQPRGNTDENEIRMIKPNGTIIYKGR